MDFAKTRKRKEYKKIVKMFYEKKSKDIHQDYVWLEAIKFLRNINPGLNLVECKKTVWPVHIMMKRKEKIGKIILKILNFFPYFIYEIIMNIKYGFKSRSKYEFISLKKSYLPIYELGPLEAEHLFSKLKNRIAIKYSDSNIKYDWMPKYNNIRRFNFESFLSVCGIRLKWADYEPPERRWINTLDDTNIHDKEKR